MKQVPYCIRRYHRKFSLSSYLAPRIYSPMMQGVVARGIVEPVTCHQLGGCLSVFWSLANYLCILRELQLGWFPSGMKHEYLTEYEVTYQVRSPFLFLSSPWCFLLFSSFPSLFTCLNFFPRSPHFFSYIPQQHLQQQSETYYFHLRMWTANFHKYCD
jgi:hypothetical protein